jgi:30S ribosomal protein S31
LQPQKINSPTKKIIMGRGDKKTKRGKISKGTFGKSRPARPAKEKKAEVKTEEKKA